MPEQDAIIMPFTGLPAEDIASVVKWLLEVHKDYGLGVEALDAFLSEFEETGGDVHKAMFFANCEWDL